MHFINEDNELVEGTPVSASDLKLIQELSKALEEAGVSYQSERETFAIIVLQKYNFTLKTAKKPAVTRKK